MKREPTWMHGTDTGSSMATLKPEAESLIAFWKR
jgi:hypothetical protein